MSRRETAARDFLGDAGWAGAAQSILAADASFRRYERVRLNDREAVLMDAPPPQEDIRPFARISRYLTQLGFSAPRILAEDERRGFMLLEDLGDTTYTRALSDGMDAEMLYNLAIDTLVRLHQVSSGESAPADTPAYDLDALLNEARLFVDWYLPAVTGLPLSDAAKAEYDDAWRACMADVARKRETLVLRDYHVDNLMWLPARPGTARCGLLDFQDALIGARAYDVMSLLEDARRDVPHDLRDTMLQRYFDGLGGVNEDTFMADFAVLGAGRHAKVIGIFTRLCHRDGKCGYLEHIPRLWRLLENSLNHPALAPVATWFEEHVPAQIRIIPDPTPPTSMP